MDFASIGLSASLSAILFVIMEFTVILPLFKRIVTNAVSDMVKNDLIPTISGYIDSKISELTATLTKSIWAKVKGMFGGRQKGLNSLMAQLQDPDFDIEDLDLDAYEPSTIDKILTIAENLSPVLQNSLLLRGSQNGNQTQEVQQQQDKDKNGIQDGPQAFLPSQIERSQ